MMPDQISFPALVDEAAVKEFSAHLLDLVGFLQTELHRLSGVDSSLVGSSYGVLMEIYGLRTRAYILLNDSKSHVVGALGFSQGELISMLDRISAVVRAIGSLKVLASLVMSIATFTVSLGEGKVKVVNFLFKEICDELIGCEGG